VKGELVEQFVETLVQGIVLGGVYSLVALGIVIIYKSSGVFNLAQGPILMVMAYIMFAFYVSLGLPLIVAFLLLFITAALMGFAIERLTLRPLIGQSVLTMLMLTLVVGFLLTGVAILAWGGDAHAFNPSFIPTGTATLGFISIPWAYLWAFIVAIIIFIVFIYLFRYTKLGLGMRAVAESHRVSQSMGINVKRIFTYSWVISCIVAAVGGVLLGSLFIVSPELRWTGLAKALPVVILGGLESVPGALIGGLIIGVAEMLGATYIDQHVGGGFREITPFILMLLILLFRPHGLFGLKTIERI
jgi:branched-chain amino acid transport system permease protein